MSDQWYVQLPVTTDTETLKGRAKDRLIAAFPGFNPDLASDLVNIVVDALSPMAQNAAEVAAIMPPATLRALGTKLFGVPYSAGSPARTTATFNLVDDQGPYRIPARFELDVDGFAFAVDADTDIDFGSDTATGVPITATLIGSAQNNLVGAVVVPIGALRFVSDVAIDAPTDGGEDAQTDEDYQSFFSQWLQLIGVTLVTERDFEIFALLWPGVGRAVFQNDGARNIAGSVTDPDGETVPSPVKTAMIAQMVEFEQVNTTIAADDPTYVTVSVTYSIHPYPFPGFDPADLLARTDAQLATWLSPANWGTASTGEPVPGVWHNEPIVYVNKLIELLGIVDGVDRVVDITITGSAGSADVDGNWDMSADFALPRPGTFTGSVV